MWFTYSMEKTESAQIFSIYIFYVFSGFLERFSDSQMQYVEKGICSIFFRILAKLSTKFVEKGVVNVSVTFCLKISSIDKSITIDK